MSDYTAALSQHASTEATRRSLETTYKDRFTLVHQEEAAAFDLAAQALVRQGRPGYFRRSLGRGAFKDPLTTGFRIIDEPVYVQDNERTGVIVPAVRVGLHYASDDEGKLIPYKDIERAQKGKADIATVARALGSAVSGIEFRGYLLATHREDIADAWAGARMGIVREAPVGSRRREIAETLWHSSGYRHDGHINHALHSRPQLAMWSVPLPELTKLGRPSGEVPIIKKLQTNLAPYRSPEAYNHAATETLVTFAQRKPAVMHAMGWLHAAEFMDRPASSLGALAVNPVPASSRDTLA